MLAGSIPGALLLKHVDARAIKLVFGVVVLGLGTEMLTREFSQKRARASQWMLAVIGVAAGVLCGLFGVGALLAAYVSRVTDDTNAFKANISAVFIVDGTFRIVLYSVLGLLTFDTVKTAAILLPFAALGPVCRYEVQPRSGRKVGAQAHVRAAGTVGCVADRGKSVNGGAKR